MERFTISLDESLARQFDALIGDRGYGNRSEAVRDLAERLTNLQHEHHDLTVAALHSHLDHENCLESVILKGPTAAVRQFADALMAERGVRHGKLNLIALEAEEHHAHDRHGPAHVHYRPTR